MEQGLECENSCSEKNFNCGEVEGIDKNTKTVPYHLIKSVFMQDGRFECYSLVPFAVLAV